MNHTTATLDRLVEPVVRIFTPEVARALINIRADPEVQARMDKLADKCNEGRLTSEEREEYETSIRFANYLAILQAKARKLLQDDEPFFRLPSPKGQFMRLQSQRRLETGVDFL